MKHRTFTEEYIGKNAAGLITDYPTVALEIRTKQVKNKYFLQRILNRLHFIF